jgi:hypothetical protein
LPEAQNKPVQHAHPAPMVASHLGVDRDGKEAIFPRLLFAMRGQVNTEHDLTRGECPTCGATVLPARLAQHQAGKRCKAGNVSPDDPGRDADPVSPGGASTVSPALPPYRAQLDKSAILRHLAPLFAAEALPAYGRRRKEQKAIAHAVAAAMIGYRDPASYTRNCNRSWKRNARKIRQRMVRAQRRNSKPNWHSFTFGPGKPKPGEKDFKVVAGARHPDEFWIDPKLDQLREDPEVGAYFKDVKSGNGYLRIPLWFLDPKMPGRPIHRLVLCALLEATSSKQAPAGIFSREGTGEASIDYTYLASRLGVCRDTVSDAIRFWSVWGSTSDNTQKFGAGIDPEGKATPGKLSGPLFRVIEQEGYFELNGSRIAKGQTVPEGAKWRQPPNRIIYLPGRILHEQQAAEEKLRLSGALANLRVNLRDSQFAQLATKIHSELLEAITGKDHRLDTFYSLWRQTALKAGVPSSLMELLIPFPNARPRPTPSPP